MFLSYLTKSNSTFIPKVFGLVIINNLLIVNSANAFSVSFQNGSFEDAIAGSQNGWNTIGDVTTTTTIDGVSPTNLINQAIITTAHQDGIFNRVTRIDDSGLNFNESGINPVSADTNLDLLQQHLNIDANALDIDRAPTTLGGVDLNAVYGPRTAKEGSGMYQEFTVTLGADETEFTISFDWAYLSNDGRDPIFGDQDYAFWTLGQYNSGTMEYTTAFDGGGEIDVLEVGNGPYNINDPAPGVGDYSNTADYSMNPMETFTVSGLTPNSSYTYRLGFGVVDVDGLEVSSALLLDNVEVVPFEFTPSTGIGLVLGLFGLGKLRKQLKK